MYYIDGNTFQHDHMWHDKLWENILFAKYAGNPTQKTF